ncbi:MAG: pyridoxamine kinase [Coriobacteriales bacterium]|jgi:pyridoxine kinase|nr:pyridoxamine kinase [Coriobacteriales bacterium]
MQKRVITIQDISCVGRCSLTVALPILSAGGIETSILPTAILSTHTGGFTGYTFRDLTDDVRPIASHWQELGLSTDAIYTGYLGSEEQLALMKEFFAKFKDEQTLVMVDPAMADQGKLYPAFDQKFALGMRDLCKQADIIVPNLTEATFMLQKPYPGEDYDRDYIHETLRELSALGSCADGNAKNISKVVLTGVSFEPGRIGAIGFDAGANEFVSWFTDRIDGYYHGTGDIYSSALLAGLLNDKSLEDAIRIACEFTVGAIRRTHLAQTDPKYGVDFEHELGSLISLLS